MRRRQRLLRRLPLRLVRWLQRKTRNAECYFEDMSDDLYSEQYRRERLLNPPEPDPIWGQHREFFLGMVAEQLKESNEALRDGGTAEGKGRWIETVNRAEPEPGSFRGEE